MSSNLRTAARSQPNKHWALGWSPLCKYMILHVFSPYYPEKSLASHLGSGLAFPRMGPPSTRPRASPKGSLEREKAIQAGARAPGGGDMLELGEAYA